MLHRFPRGMPVLVGAVAVAALLVADTASAQRPTPRPTQRPAPRPTQRPADQASWKSDWTLQLESTYDDNPFRLSTRQQRNLSDGGSPQYADMNEPQDVINSVGLE